MRDQGYDVGPGTSIDDLIIRPTGEALSEYRQALLSLEQLTRLREIAAGQLTVSDDRMDDLAAFYGLSRRQLVRANGMVEIRLNTNSSTTISSSLTFTTAVNDRGYRVPQTVQAVPLSAGGVESPTRKFIRPRGDGSWYVHVQVRTQSDAAGGILVPGDRLNLPDGPPNIRSVIAVSTFVGGTARETNRQLAERLIDGQTRPALTGRRQGLALAQSVVDGASLSIVNTNNPLNRRSSNNMLGIQAGGKVDLYARTGSPIVQSFVVDAQVVDQGDRIAQVVLSPEQAVGVYDVRIMGVTNPSGMVGAIDITDTQLSVQPFEGYLPQMEDQQVRRSTNARWVIQFEDNREVGGSPVETWGANGSTIEQAFIIVVRLMPDLDRLAREIYFGPYLLPGVDLALYAGTPVDLTVSVGLRPADGITADVENLRTAVAAAVNRLPIGTPALNAFSLGRRLSDILSDVELVNIAAQGLIALPDGQTVNVTQQGSELPLPINPALNLGPETLFFTTVRDNVEVSIV